NAASRDFVLITRTNTTLCRADGTFALLAQAIDHDVVRQNRVCTIGDEQASLCSCTILAVAAAAANAHATLFEIIELGHEALWIDHHALTKHARDIGAQHAAWHETYDDLLITNDELVTGVWTSSITHDHVRTLGEDVDDLSFALVAPLRAHDHD